MAEGVVLWDFDGTLATREGMWRGCLVTALTAVAPGHGVTGADVKPGLRDGFPWHRPEMGHPALSTPDAWWQALQPIFLNAYTQAGVDADLAALAAQAVRTHYTDPACWMIFPDSVIALEQLSSAGWRHIVVSNHVPELDALLQALDLNTHFEGVVNSSLIGWEKPHRRMFEAAMERAGWPDRVWMVGDNPVADIAGAKAFGIPGILVSRSQGGLRPAVRRILAEDPIPPRRTPPRGACESSGGR